MNRPTPRRRPRYTSTPRMLTRTLDDLLFDTLEAIARKLKTIFSRTTKTNRHHRQ